MAGDWDDAVKQAMKILGPKGKIPDAKPIEKYSADVIGKTLAAFHKGRDDLEAIITDLESQLEKISSMLDQFEAKVEKDNFGLDDDNDKEQSKKIDQARDILSAFLKDAEKRRQDGIKGLKEAARHLTLLEKYKPEPTMGG